MIDVIKDMIENNPEIANINNKRPFLYLIDGNLYVIGQNILKEVDNIELNGLYDEYITAGEVADGKEIMMVMKQIIHKCELLEKMLQQNSDHVETKLKKEQIKQLEEQVKLYTFNNISYGKLI